ncbi:hypothetical protein D3C76_873740 [compost metagenome]
MARMPGIDRRGQVRVMDGEGTLCHLQLSKQHTPRLAQAGDDGGIFLRDECLVNRHARCRGHAGRVQQVLYRQRDAMQRATAFATRQFAFRLACLVERQLRSDRGKGVQRPVEPFDSR